MADACGDIESIWRIVKAAGWRRIGVDGVDGAGKSYLADKLSQELACPTLDVDDYLHQNQGGYVDFIDYPALKAAVSSMPAFILYGACLREVLENLGVTLDANIYIKRMRDGLWADEDECVFPEGVDAAIEALAGHLAMISGNFDEPSEHAGRESDGAAPHLAHEVMHYHEKYQPHESADLVFERTD